MTARRAAPSPQLTLFMAINGPTRETVPKRAPPPKFDIDGLFATFYAEYPRKVARKAARRAFGTALKEASFEQIMQGLAGYVESIRRRGTRPDYIAHPSSWLNGGRWADEPDAAYSAATASAARVGLEFRAKAGVRR